ncbi:MAG: DEAD/DEAH box helicase [Limnochordia bacterium]|jgi:competence protein ComFA
MNRLYTVYFLEDGDRLRIDYSPQPSLDAAYLRAEGALLSSPLPAWAASSLVKCLRGGLFGPPRNPKHLAMRADRWLRQRGFSPPLGDRRLRPGTIPQPLEQSEATIAGRLLLPTEAARALGRPCEEDLHLLYLMGRCDRRPGIDSDGCVRCGSQEVQRDYCPLCLREDCGRCPDCSSMGEIRSCRLLYFAPLRERGDPCQIQPIFPGELTLAQERASLQLKDVLYSSREALIWAVCGAGKTEVAFPAIADALARGQRVLFSVPRREVVIELEPRLKKAFPGLPLSVFYGGRGEWGPLGPLVLATTHQTLRFYRAFDLAILDESDAYPYRGSRLLPRALKRSLKEEGRLVYMTATPSPALHRRARWGRIPLIAIPARYHGHPVPEPKLLARPMSHTPLRLPPICWEIIHMTRQQGFPLFIFVPTVALSEAVGSHLSSQLGSQVDYTHARDPKRSEKRALFAQQGGILVTTTLLERGITVPCADVLVLFAHHPVFDAGTLVQMAGRSGRSIQRPWGDVYFLGRRVTAEMRRARHMIREMNRLARAGGYLNEERSS